ncbi:hypothetical protein ACQCX2_15565 [Propionibacteriaceae bacterium Y1700]|uniref:hypothetical protein n=1 Tax=Microlunatus sp. Y1700 TaxID=3418487 RepID=UPI003DA6DEBF
MEHDTQQWTPEARNQFDTIAQQAIDTLKAHVDLVRGAGPDDADAQERSGAQLAAALDALADAEFDLTGDFPYVLDLEITDEDVEDGTETDDDIDTVAVMMRTDFSLEDTDALMKAARAVVVDSGELDAEEAAESITDLESAIFAVAHSLGWDSLLDDQVPGLAALSTYAEVVRDPDAVELEVDED